MQSKSQQHADETTTAADKFIIWLFVFATVVCIGLGVWALFLKT
jgi:hypothetical protein